MPRYGAFTGLVIKRGMPRRRSNRRLFQPTYIRAWREFRDLTQEQLAERIETMTGIATTTASISRLENGKQPYSQQLLEAIADALRCDVPDLIARPPDKQWDDSLTLLKALDPEKLDQAKRIIRALSA